jgi:DNA repair exonuclease SbcCD ATPase subunit
MTPADEQAIEDAKISVRLSAIFREAEHQAQSALQARRNEYRRTEDWEEVAKQHRETITGLEAEVARLRQDLADATEAIRPYASTFTALRWELGAIEDADLVEAARSLTAEMKRLIMQAIRKRERAEQAEAEVGRLQRTIARIREERDAAKELADALEESLSDAVEERDAARDDNDRLRPAASCLNDVARARSQAEAAAAHFYRCPVCQPGEPCPEGWAYVVALGLMGESERG